MKWLRLSKKRFFCRVLVLLCKNILFLEFPHHLNVLNKSPILHKRGELTKNQINAPIKYYHHLPIALVVFRAMPRVQFLNRRGGIIYSHPTEVVVGRSNCVGCVDSALDCAGFRPNSFCGAGGADGVSDDVGGLFSGSPNPPGRAMC